MKTTKIKLEGDSNPKSFEKYDGTFGKMATIARTRDKRSQNIESPIRNCDFLIFNRSIATVISDTAKSTICKVDIISSPF